LVLLGARRWKVGKSRVAGDLVGCGGWIIGELSFSRFLLLSRFGLCSILGSKGFRGLAEHGIFDPLFGRCLKKAGLDGKIYRSLI
jgi:hypothetical protein